MLSACQFGSLSSALRLKKTPASSARLRDLPCPAPESDVRPHKHFKTHTGPQSEIRMQSRSLASNSDWSGQVGPVVFQLYLDVLVRSICHVMASRYNWPLRDRLSEPPAFALIRRVALIPATSLFIEWLEAILVSSPAHSESRNCLQIAKAGGSPQL